MRKPVVKRVLLWLMAIGLSVVGMVLWIRSQAPQRCRLPNGIVLTLRGWSYGKEAVLKQRIGPWWNFFSPPAEIKFAQEPKTNSLFLWINGVPIVHRQIVPGITQEEMGRWWDRVEVADETGFALSAWNGKRIYPNGIIDYTQQNVVEQGPLGDGYECMQIHAFPRRGKQVIVRFYSKQQTRPIAEFTVPNPTPGPFPTVKPDPLPITRREDGLEGTLTRIEPAKTHRYIDGRGASTYSASPVQGFYRDPEEQERRHVEFRFRDRDNPHAHWRIKNLSMTDATGNRYDPSLLWFDGESDSPCMEFSDLQSAEPLMLRVECCRNADSDFVPSELWTVSGITIPHANAVTRSQAKWSQDGVTIELLGIAGAGSTKLDHASPGLTSDVPAVRLRVTPAQSLITLMLRGKDDQGREISAAAPSYTPKHRWIDNSIVSSANSTIINFNSKTNSTTMTGLASDRQYSETTLFFHIPPGAKTLDLTFAINKSRFLEFTPILPATSPGK